MTKLHWTLATLAILGGTASADDDEVTTDDVRTGVAMSVETSGSQRGVAQDYIVLPRGGELTGQMKFVTAQPSLGGEQLRFSDLALFGLSGRWSLLSKLELSASVDFLAKQPSFTDEKPWQSVGVGLRSPLARRVAIAMTGAGGHLIDHSGMWTRSALAIQWRKPIHELMTFDVAAGVNGITLSAPKSTRALITEAALQTSVLFREPRGHVGSWVGIAYALPVTARGTDPTTGMAVDPQPRLDFRIGAVLSLVKAWDVYAEYAIIDRGDLSDASTRLPILDGGFDQHQVMLGVTRHITASKPRRSYSDPMQMSAR